MKRKESGRSMKANASFVRVVLGLAAIGVASMAAAQPTVSPAITINQVSWDMAATGTVPHSEYGDLQFDFDADPSDVYFINIVARLAPAGTPAWLVQNMPLLSGDLLEEPYSEAGQVVDLSMLGVIRGTDVTGAQIEYSVDLSLDPIPIPAPFSPDFSTVIGAQEYSFGGGFSPTPIFPGLLDAPRPPNKPAWNGDRSVDGVWRSGMPNGETGTLQCGPAAIANSMHWLQARYPKLVDLGEQTWNDTLLKIKEYAEWVPPVWVPATPDRDGYWYGGITNEEGIKAKLRFALDQEKYLDLIVRYEADQGKTGLGASVTVGGKTATRNGPSRKPTFGWLLQQLRAGEDVEVFIDWLDNAGRRIGGHIVSVVGALRIGNKMWIWTNDDACQGHKEGDPPVPPQNDGLRTNKCHQVTIENGGYMRLSGFGMNNRVTATWSESVGRDSPAISGWGMAAVSLLLLSGMAIKFGRRRAARAAA